MTKKAFCVGVDDYPYQGLDLRGCVNDANAWANLLITHFDFPSTHVKLMTNAEATKKNIISGIKNLLSGAQAGDILVYTNSSHGSYIPDESGDEKLYDEVICPYDVKDNVIVDDELRELFGDLPQGVKLTVISDSCYSGTITREIFPEERRIRFLNPSLRGVRELRDAVHAKPRRYRSYPQSAMKEMLISGCKDIEYSYDARIGGVYHGAMSCYAQEAIREANYRITHADLIKRVSEKLRRAMFNQHPQLEGKVENKEQLIFL